MVNRKKNIALVCAAGVGTRMGVSIPKQYLTLKYKGEEKTILEITLDKFLSHPEIDLVIVALNKEDKYFTNLKSNYTDSLNFKNYLNQTKVDKLYYCYGCGDRIHTVYSLASNCTALVNVLKWDSQNCNIFIHDVARPTITAKDISLLIAKSDNLSPFCDYLDLNKTNIAALLPAAELVDSVKEVSRHTINERKRIFLNENLDRSKMVLAQTPQVFNLAYFFYLLNFLLDKSNDNFYNLNLKDNSLFVLPYTSFLKFNNSVFDENISFLEVKQIAQGRMANFNKGKNDNSSVTQVLTDDTAVIRFFNDIVEIIPFSRYSNSKITVSEDLELAQYFLNKE